MATRELYASDASLYRRRPRAVLRAGASEDLEAAMAIARELGVPITMRGAGTSLDLVISAQSLRQADINLVLLEVEVGEARASAVLANAECVY